MASSSSAASTKRKADSDAVATDDNDDSTDKSEKKSKPNADNTDTAVATAEENGDSKSEAAPPRAREKRLADTIAKFDAMPRHKLDSDAILKLLDAKPKGVKRGKAATEAQIAKVEKALACTFPPALRAIYLKYNGVAGKEEGEGAIGGEDVSFNSPFFFPLIKATEPLEDDKYSVLNFNKWIRTEVDEEPGMTRIKFWQKYIVFGTDGAGNIEEHDVPIWAIGLEDGVVYKATHYLWDVEEPKEAYEPMPDFTAHLKQIFDLIVKESGDAIAAAPPAVAGAPPAGADELPPAADE